MIQKTITYECRFCHSRHIVKNGHNAQGHQQYWCKDCGKRTVLELRPRYTEEKKEQIIADYYERSTPSAVRGVGRVFGVSRPTLAAWLKKRRQPAHQ
jgi:transposase-like protein